MASKLNFLHRIPFLRILLCLITGILLALKYPMSITALLVMFLVVFISIFFFLAKHPTLSHSSALLFILIFGALITEHRESISTSTLPNVGDFSGTIIECKTTHTGHSKLLVNIDSIHSESWHHHSSETVVVYLLNHPSNYITPSDRINFSGKLKSIENKNNPYEFNYKRYMNDRKIYKQIFLRDEFEILRPEKYTFKIFPLKLRAACIDIFERHKINGDKLAILSALTLGDKSMLDNEVKATFSAAGIMHILAVSGLHVGIIYLAISKLLLLIFGRKLRFIQLIIIIILLWFYALLTGMSPSVLRSCAMFSIFGIAHTLQRKTNVYNCLAISAVVLLIINPFFIRNIGFLLSYSAVFSIVYLQPRIEKRWTPQHKVSQYLWSLATVSIAAQIGTLPMSLYTFHIFPSYFIIANILIIPLIPIIIFSAFTLLMINSIPVASTIGAIMIKLLLNIVISISELITSIPHATINHIYISKTTTIIIYLIFLLLTLYKVLNKQKIKDVILVASILLMVMSSIKYIETQKQEQIIIYNAKEPTISFIYGKSHKVYTLHDIPLCCFNAAIGYNTNQPQKISPLMSNTNGQTHHLRYKNEKINVNLIRWKEPQTPRYNIELVLPNNIKKEENIILNYNQLKNINIE